MKSNFTQPALPSILPPEERHVIQFDIGEEAFILNPTCERDRDALVRRMIAAGINDYTVRTLAHAIDESGTLIVKWFDIRNSGTYAPVTNNL